MKDNIWHIFKHHPSTVPPQLQTQKCRKTQTWHPAWCFRQRVRWKALLTSRNKLTLRPWFLFTDFICFFIGSINSWNTMHDVEKKKKNLSRKKSTVINILHIHGCILHCPLQNCVIKLPLIQWKLSLCYSEIRMFCSPCGKTDPPSMNSTFGHPCSLHSLDFICIYWKKISWFTSSYIHTYVYIYTFKNKSLSRCYKKKRVQKRKEHVSQRNLISS